jgi:hypothetical protein
MLKNPIRYNQFPNGQSGLGKLEQNKFFSMTNIEVHDETGIAKCQYAMESESTTPNEECFSAISPTGNIYYVSKESGKIWKRTTAGSYSLVVTNANGAHTGCRYFNGYIWYWTSTKLSYFVADTEASPTQLTATGTGFRGSCEANNTMLLADGRYIARVDASNSFSAQALVLPAQYKTTELINIGDDVLIGTYVGTDVAYCRVFLWDTVSTSWTSEDEIFEIGVNCFLQLDNIRIAQCGTSGRFYYWNGSQMVYFNKIRGITTALGEQKTVVYNGRPLFANSDKIYSIHREDSGLPYAIVAEYTATDTISSLAVQGQTLLASVGTGVDKRGTSLATAVIETPEAQGEVTTLEVEYDDYPEGVGIETKTQNGSYVTQTPIVDIKKRVVYFNGGLGDCVVFQARITLTPDGTSNPKIKGITLK